MQHVPCAKCGSSDVHFGRPFGYLGSLTTRLFTLGRYALTYYVCCACGHVEISVESESDRRKIASEWPKA
jgi:hypothetical protein